MSSKEATVFILDNSSWARNGDYEPNRWVCQLNALELMVSTKAQSNPENQMGLLFMGGSQVSIALTPTQGDPDKLLGLTHDVKLGGKPQLLQALSIAQLVLKHRKDKTLRQRIVVMVASPVDENEKELINLAKKLRKNSIGVDLILMGEYNKDLRGQFETFINTVKNSENSNFIVIEQGHDPYETIFNLISSQGANQAGNAPGPGAPAAGGNIGGGAGGDVRNEYGGVNYNDDPELAMALRMSLEESKAATVNTQVAQPAQVSAPVTAKQEDQQMNIELAVQTKNQTPGGASSTADGVAENKNPEEEENQQELLRKALELSMQPEIQEQPKQSEIDQALDDPDFINELLQMVDKKEDDDKEKDDQDKKNDNDGKE